MEEIEFAKLGESYGLKGEELKKFVDKKLKVFQEAEEKREREKGNLKKGKKD